ncbi:hypothetical protein [Armatimonas sp.]|uniref:hypothetical protein n=1 Tax=Armatimonas sp. TaxID=1872638 RepID=UPI003751E7D1
MSNVPPFDIRAPFFDQALDDDDIIEEFDENAPSRYRDEIIAQFERSEEGVALAASGQELHWAGTFVEFMIRYVAAGLPDLDPDSFDSVIFEEIPRKVSVEASEAAAIIVELRAFWSFLGRAYLLENAPGFVAALDDEAAMRLERELANPENYGPAKSMFMQGRDRGFDMSSEEGIQAWLTQYNRELGFAPPVNLSSSGSSSGLGAMPLKKRSEKDRNRSRIARASRKRNGRK